MQKEIREGGVYNQHGLREVEGEFVTLYKERIDGSEMLGYFRMNRECFYFAVLRKLSPLLIKHRTRFLKPVLPKEGLAVCIREVDRCVIVMKKNVIKTNFKKTFLLILKKLQSKLIISQNIKTQVI